jgi:hypothetical protein
MRFPPEWRQLLHAPKPHWLGPDSYGIRGFWQGVSLEIQQFSSSFIRIAGESHQF